MQELVRHLTLQFTEKEEELIALKSVNRQLSKKLDLWLYLDSGDFNFNSTLFFIKLRNLKFIYRISKKLIIILTLLTYAMDINHYLLRSASLSF